MLEKFWHRMHCAAREEQQLAGPEIRFGCGVTYPNRAAARDHIEIFVAGRVIVRWRWLVDAEHPRARLRPVGQIGVDQERRRRRAKTGGDRGDVETSGLRGCVCRCRRLSSRSTVLSAIGLISLRVMSGPWPVQS